MFFFDNYFGLSLCTVVANFFPSEMCLFFRGSKSLSKCSISFVDFESVPISIITTLRFLFCRGMRLRSDFDFKRYFFNFFFVDFGFHFKILSSRDFSVVTDLLNIRYDNAYHPEWFNYPSSERGVVLTDTCSRISFEPFGPTTREYAPSRRLNGWFHRKHTH